MLQALARRDRRIVPVVGRVGVRPGITRPDPAGRFHVVGFDAVKRAVLKAAGAGSLRLSAAGLGRGEPGGCAAVHRRRSVENAGIAKIGDGIDYSATRRAATNLRR